MSDAEPPQAEEPVDEQVEAEAREDAGGTVPSAERMPLFERLFLRRLQRGEPRAFAELVRLHKDRVFSLTLRMLGDRDEAEDVSQEVLVAVHRHLPRFRGDCRLSTWIYRVARNHCLNRIKYLSRRTGEGPGEVEGAEAAETAGRLLSAPERPDRALLGAEERQKVQQALQRLEAPSRLLVVLRDIEGMSYDEIARVAELPEGTVKSRLHRARAALATMLAEAGMVPDGCETPKAAPRSPAVALAGGRP